MSRNNGRQEAENRYRQRQSTYQGLEQDITGRLPQMREQDQALTAQMMQQFLAILNDPSAMSGFQEMATTGGWDTSRRASMDQNIAGLKAFGKDGGIDAESMNRFRGNGYFDDLVKTGGWSDADVGNVRARTASQVPSFYGNLRNSMDSARAAQGGYSPGYNYQTAKMARDASREGVGAIRDTEIGLGESIRSGKLSGATGMSSAENALQSLRTGNMYRGMTGAADVETGMMNSINQARLTGMGGINSVNNTRLNALGGMNTVRGTAGPAEREFTNLLRLMGASDAEAAQMLSVMSEGGFNWAGLLGFLPFLFNDDDKNSEGSRMSRLMRQIRNVGQTSPEPPRGEDPYHAFD